MKPSDRERLLSKVEIVDGHWLWLSTIQPTGYGQFWLDGKHTYAHRAAYTLFVGPIPAGLDIDHLCRVRHCCNPEHLEPVTRSENLRRGNVDAPRPWDVMSNNRNTSGVRGVSPSPASATKPWKAYITVAGKTHYLGYHDTIEEAAAARRTAELELVPHALVSGLADGGTR